MRYREIVEAGSLREGRDAPLYHGTSLSSLFKIIRSDTLTASEVSGERPGGSTLPPGVSLSRNLRYAETAAANAVGRLEESSPLVKTELRTADHGAILMIDQARLAHRHRVMPICDLWGNPGGSRGYGDASMAEAEEYVVGSIRSVSKVITGIKLLDPMGYRKFEKTCRKKWPHTGATFDTINSLLVEAPQAGPLRESLKAYDEYRDIPVTLHRNPSRATAMSLFKRYGGLRGYIDQNALWVWDSEFLHDDAIAVIQPGDGDGFYLYLLPKLVQIKGQDDFAERREIIRTMDQPLRNVYGDRVPYRRDDGEYM